MKKSLLWIFAALFLAVIISIGFLQSNISSQVQKTAGVSAFDQKWFSAPMEDVVTKKKFRLADFKGKPIVLELMAIWCPLCLEQGDEISKAKQRLGDRVVFVSVDIDPSETTDSLARYVKQYRRDWLFTVDAGGRFNDFFRLSPPATPLIIIDKKGEITIHAGSIAPAGKLVDIIDKLG